MAIRDSEEKAREAQFGIVVTNGTRSILRKSYEDFLTLRIARGASRETGEPNLSRLTGKCVIRSEKSPKGLTDEFYGCEKVKKTFRFLIYLKDREFTAVNRDAKGLYKVYERGTIFGQK